MRFFPDSKSVVEILGFSITWYALIILTGGCLAYFLAKKQLKKMGHSDDFIDNFVFGMVIFGLLGARLYYVLFELHNYNNLIDIINIRQGGLAIHGGLIGGTLWGVYYFRKHKVSILAMADVIFPYVLLAQSIGRWGNFMNQEAHGEVVSEAYFRYFPSFIKNKMFINGQYYIPTFLYESLANLLGFFLIVFVLKKYGRKRRGDLMFAYLAYYGVVRFIIEGMRTDSLMFLNLRVAQLISILFVIVGLIGMLGGFSFILNRKKPVILFDLDGTLIDSHPLIVETYLKTFAHFKPDLKLSKEQIEALLGPTLETSLRKYLNDDQIEQAIKYHREYQLSVHDDRIRLMDNVKEVLKTLKEQGYDMAVVSNKPNFLIKKALVHCEIDQYFLAIVGYDDVDEPKPSPKGLKKACELLNVGYSDLIYLGDNENDILATKAIGGYSILVGENPLAIRQKPCSVIQNMVELLAILKENKIWEDKWI